MPFGGLLTLGLVQGGTSILSGIFGANQANKAAGQQTQSAQQAIDFEKGVYGDQQKQQQPFVDFGTASIGRLMEGFSNGTFGANPGFKAAPDFTAPSLEDARNSPGYQFTKQQGEQSILKAQAAAGGAITGGTEKALDTFGTGLADSTYSNVFNRALSTYQTNNNKNLQAYEADLQGNQQNYQQLFAPTQLGESATANVGATGSNAARSIGDLMTQQGNARASGTVGSANALTGGITTGINDITQSAILDKYLKAKNPAPAPRAG